MKIVNSLFEDLITDSPWYITLYHRVRWKYRDIRYFCRKIIERIRYGFPLEESWDFRSGCTKYVLPRLKHFRNNLNGYPCDLSMEEWELVLDKMIWSFEHMEDHISPIYSDDYDHRFSVEKTETGTLYTPLNETGTIDYTPVEEHNKKIQEGLNLFAKYYQNLWD